MPRRRNSLGAGGYDFNANRDLSSSRTASWIPQALPTVVVLTEIPDDHANPDLALASRELHAILAAEDDNQIVELCGATIRLQRPEGTRGPVGVLLPLDGLFDIRIAAAQRLWRGLTGRKPGPDPGLLTKARRDRLILALRALDGRLEKASYREIAEALFGSRRMPERGWKTDDLRDRTVRLARLGHAMMQGGYRRLLLYPFRGRT